MDADIAFGSFKLIFNYRTIFYCICCLYTLCDILALHGAHSIYIFVILSCNEHILCRLYWHWLVECLHASTFNFVVAVFAINDFLASLHALLPLRVRCMQLNMLRVQVNWHDDDEDDDDNKNNDIISILLDAEFIL